MTLFATVAINGSGTVTAKVIKIIIAVGAVAVVVCIAYAVGYTDGWERREKWRK